MKIPQGDKTSPSHTNEGQSSPPRKTSPRRAVYMKRGTQPLRRDCLGLRSVLMQRTIRSRSSNSGLHRNTHVGAHFGVLALLPHHSYRRCIHCGDWVKGIQDQPLVSIFAASHESNYLKIKIKKPKGLILAVGSGASCLFGAVSVPCRCPRSQVSQ